MLWSILAVAALLARAQACCEDDVSVVEYELAFDEDVLTFQTYDTFSDFADWVKTYLVRGMYKGKITVGRRKKTVERRMDRLVVVRRGPGTAPKMSDIRYFQSMGDASDPYENYLQWRVDLDSSEEDGCELMEITVPDLYARKLVEEVNQFVWVMPCEPDASDCTTGAQRQESTIEFHRMSIYGEDNTDAVTVIDIPLWESEDWDEIAKDMNQYFNMFEDYYDDGNMDVRYNVVWHRVCTYMMKILDGNGNVIARGELELQARYDSMESFNDDIPSDSATQIKFILFEDGAADWEAANEIAQEIVDYTGMHAAPYVDHRLCVDCCVGNESFAEYEVAMDTDYLAETGSFEAFCELIDWMQAELQNGEFADEIVIRPNTKESYNREKDILTIIKRGQAGNAPTRSYLKYHKSFGDGDVYQNEMGWSIDLEDDCSFPMGIEETEEYEDDGVKRTIDQNAWIMPCMPTAENCTHDVFTWRSKFQFDLNPAYGTGNDDCQTLVDLPHAWNTTDWDAICMDAERFWVDFCEYYDGSNLDLRFRRVWHRFTAIYVDFYVNGMKISRGRIEFQSRYDTRAAFMADEPNEEATQFKVRIFQWRTEPDFWGETKFLAEKLINYIAEYADPWVDHRECATDMPSMAPTSKCCVWKGNGDPAWENKCAGYGNIKTCQRNNRANFCDWMPC